MKWLDTIKENLPMTQMQQLFSAMKTNMPKKPVKVYAGMEDAKAIIKRINYLFAENSSLSLGKQEIYKREITDSTGNKKMFTYTVDFTKPEETKRLRTVLLELIDMTAEDATTDKKQAISGYLDYIAQASI